MRIAQLMAGAPSGGAELFFERMTVALAQAGQDILPVIRREPARNARLRAAGLAPVQLRYGGRLDLLSRPRIDAALRAFRPEVAIAWMSRAAAHLPRGPWINIGRLGGYYDLKYFKSCDYLVGNTHGIVKYIIEGGFPATRVAYLPNFVDDFGDTEPAMLDLPAQAPVLLGLGRLHKVKGFDTLIRAMALLPEACCVIAGEGPERPALEALIAELGLANRVKLLGWRNDVGALLKRADIFVSSSRHEPLGNMVLEAFGAQTPILATRAEGPTELIRDGVDGMLTPIDDPATLADNARILLGDSTLRAGLTQAGRARFLDQFAQQTVLKTWLAYLHKVAS